MNLIQNFIKNSHKKSSILIGVFVFISSIAIAQNRVDASLVHFTSPLGTAHTGLGRTLSVRVRNTGNVAITSVKLEYRLNGGSPTTVVRTVSIPAPTNANQIPTQVVDVTATNGYIDLLNNQVQVNILEVNNQTDVDAKNDTVRANFASPLTGPIRVIGNSPSADYKTVTAAINDLRYRGTANSITYKLLPGSYSDNIDLNVSEIYFVNTNSKSIIFESSTGYRDVLLISEAAQQTTIKLTGIDDVTIRNIRVINKNIVSGIGIQLLNAADNVVIKNCEITVDSISNAKGFVGILASSAIGTAPNYTLGTATSAAKNLLIQDNKISGGYYGIAASAGSGSNRDNDLKIERNIITQTSYYGVYVFNAINTIVNKNKVIFRPSADIKSTGYFLNSIAVVLPGTIEITKNYVSNAGTYGMYLTNLQGLTNKYINISNNMIAGGFFSNFSANNFDIANTPTGLFMNGCTFSYVCFNSVYMDATTKPNLPDYTTAFYVLGSNPGLIRVYNNIFANANKGFAYYNASAPTSNPVTLSDNNNLYVALLDTNANPSVGFAFWNSTNRAHLRDLRTTSSKDFNSISKDPQFFSNTDLHTLSIDLDKKGSTVPLTLVSTDYDDQVRDQGAPDPPDIGADEFGPGGEDFAIIGVTPDVFRFNKPTPWRITVRYQGPTNGNKKLYFKYKINGVEYPSHPDSVIEQQFTFLSGNFKTQTFTVPTRYFITRTDYQSFNFCVYIYEKSNIGDTREYNDTLCQDICVGLEGTFTIDRNAAPGTLNTFTSFQQVYDYLKCGVSGPTVFEIQDGTYDEQINFWKVRNSSSVNNIIFKSKNNVFATKLTYINGTAENHATVLFNNAQYITLRDVTVENRSASNGTCIQLAGNSKFNTIQNNIIKVDSTLTPFPTTLIPIVVSKLGTLTTLPYGINAQENLIKDNKILGGYYGIAMFGLDTDKRDLNNIIQGNTITSFHKAGVFLEYSDTKVRNNYIVGKYGMDLEAVGIYAKSLGDRAGLFKNDISGNKITDITHMGIYLQECLGLKEGLAKKSTFVLSNNMIGGGFTNYVVSTFGVTSGINLKTCTGISILHNTIYMDAPRSSSTSVLESVARCLVVLNTNSDIEAVNNILYSNNGAIPLEYFTKLRPGNVKTGLTVSENNLYFTRYSSKTTPLMLIKRWGNTNSNPNFATNYTFSQLSSSAFAALNNFKNDNGNSSRDRKSIALPILFEEIPYNLHTYDLIVEGKGQGGIDVTDDFDKELRKGKSTDIGCDEFTVPNYDLDIRRIVNPLLSAVKPNKIVIELRNRGRYSLENIKVAIKYTLSDGENTFTFSSTDTVTLKLKKTGDTQIYTFKTRASVPSRGYYNLCAEKVNGFLNQDTVYTNNKVCVNICTGIEGDYFVGFSKTSPIPGTDTNRYFSTLQGAINEIGNSCGIADRTFVNMNPANSPYLERVSIPKFLVNLDSPLLTIQPYGTSSNTAVVIQQPASPAGDPDKIHYTVRLNGSNFVKLLNLNIKNTGANFGSAVHITRNAKNNIVEGCKIEVDKTNATTNVVNLFYPVAFTSSNKLNILDNNSFAKNGTGNRIRKNNLIGGYAGVALLGASSVDYDLDNEIDSNIIEDYFQFGIYSKNNTVKSISFNTLTPRSVSAATCVSISYNNAGEGGLINANKIINSKQIGIKLYEIEGFLDKRLIVSNNWITHNFGTSIADSSSAIFIKRVNNIGLYYNSIRYNGFVSAINITRDSIISAPIPPETNPTKTYIKCTNLDIKNNIVMVDSIGPGAKPYTVYLNNLDAATQINNNAYYTGFLSKFGFYFPNNQRSFFVWQQNTALDSKSLSVSNLNKDSIFKTGFDLNLVDTTRFDKRGVVVNGISRDFLNRKRSPRVTDIGSLEYERDSNNVSLFEILNEKAVYGTNKFTVKILNEGYKNLTTKSITLEYSLDGGLTWRGSESVVLKDLKGRYDEQLFTFSLPLQKKDFLLIPFCVRISPNGRLQGDTTTKFEKLCKDLCVGIDRGVYTLGKNGTEDFPNFALLVSALTCGFDSSVVINISPGTYNERVTIPPIGTSSEKTVTFKSLTNKASDVVLQYTNTTEDLNHHVVQLDGSMYINFKYLTFSSQAKARASGIHIADTAKYITVDNCIFRFDSTSKINTLVGVLASGKIAYTEPANASLNTIKNCEFYGGAFGIRLLGKKDNAKAGANKIMNNKFYNNYTSAIDIFYTQIDSVSNNTVNLRQGNAENVGINIYGSLTDLILIGNKISGAGNIGIVIDSCRTIARGLIANNMITGGAFVSDASLYNCGMLIRSTGAFPSKGIPYSGTIDVINNSVLYDGKSDSASALRVHFSNGLNLYNNIFANYGPGYAIHFNSDNSGVTEFVETDRNLLFTKGNTLANWRGVKCATLSVLGLQDNGNSPFNVSKSPFGYGEFDPLFKSVIDLHVNNMKLEGAGLPSDIVPTDIDGDKRNPSTPDVGCDEFFPSKDIGVFKIVTPLNNATFKDTVSVIVKVKNYGADVNVVKVKYSFDGVVVDSVSKALTPDLKIGDSTVVIFNKKISTRQAGPHILKAFTEIKRPDINNPKIYYNDDFSTYNDTTTITIISKDTSDIGVSYFESPLNGLVVKEPTDVRVAVTNYGNLVANNFDIKLIVNGKQKEVKRITTPLPGKTTEIYSFNYKIHPDTAVTFDICAKTALSDDVIEPNDENCIVSLTLGLVEESASGIVFSVHPNPTNALLSYGIDLDREKEVEIQVYDLSGRLMKKDNLGSLPTGKNTITLNYNDLAEGTYLFVVVAGENRYNGRFVLVK